MTRNKIKEVVEHCLNSESEAISAIIPIVAPSLCQAAEAIYYGSGNLVVTGVGKSGHVGRKIAASFRSIGVSAIFLGSHELFHGDSGFLKSNDILLAVSNSGKTKEFVNALDFAKDLGCGTIALVGNASSPALSSVDIVIEASVDKEAHEDNFLPTTSTTLALACGDALLVAVAELNQFTSLSFTKLHQSGSLGLEMSATVGELMIRKELAAVVSPSDSLRRLAEELTAKPHGLAIVEAENGGFLGVATDGDLRRAFLSFFDPDSVTVSEIATQQPLVMSPKLSIREAVYNLENRKPNPVYGAPVVENGVAQGLVTLHLLTQIGER